MYNFMIM